MRFSPRLIPIIVSGGAGSRLWPLSRKQHPKPFITLADGDSLIQKAYRRAGALASEGEVVTVTNHDHFLRTKDAVDTASTHVERHTFLLEPVSRDSAAAIAVAAQYVAATYGPEGILLVLPADHLIADERAFGEAVATATALAVRGKLVTFGVKPTEPETGFGYIEASGNHVKRFVEKPDLQTATAYLNAGTFFWNAGIFCMNGGVFLEELEHHCPDTAHRTKTALEQAEKSTGLGWQQYALPQKHFAPLASISVDYAVFEKSKNVAIVPCDIGWSDIGTWEKFGNLHPSDDNHNHFSGTVFLEETTQSIIHGGERLIATLGVDNLVIADTADVLLVASRDHVQSVRHLVDKLQHREESTDFIVDSLTHHAWGQCKLLHADATVRLQRLDVLPGASLGMQTHARKSVHWTMVRGVANVTNGETQRALNAHQSVHIPVGQKHNLENRTSTPIVLMEMQLPDDQECP